MQQKSDRNWLSKFFRERLPSFFKGVIAKLMEKGHKFFLINLAVSFGYFNWANYLLKHYPEAGWRWVVVLTAVVSALWAIAFAVLYAYREQKPLEHFFTSSIPTFFMGILPEAFYCWIIRPVRGFLDRVIVRPVKRLMRRRVYPLLRRIPFHPSWLVINALALSVSIILIKTLPEDRWDLFCAGTVSVVWLVLSVTLFRAHDKELANLTWPIAAAWVVFWSTAIGAGIAYAVQGNLKQFWVYLMAAVPYVFPLLFSASWWATGGVPYDKTDP